MVVLAGCATPLMKAVEKGDVASARVLLDKGADVNEQTPNGRNALIWAFLKGHATADVVRLLIDRGIGVNARDGDSRTALYWAVYMSAAPEVVRLLIDKGADPGIGGLTYNKTAKVWELQTPLQVAQARGMTVIARIIEDAEQKQVEHYAPAAVAQGRKNEDLAQRHAVRSDIDDLPVIKAKPNKNYYAIVIGIEQYRQKLPKADFAAQDAQTMTEYLIKTMGYPEENVVTLLNEHATNVNFAKYFEKWLPNNIEKDSSVFIYYSGHGAPNPKTGDAYLVPYDGDPAFIDQTGYSLKRLYDNLGKLQAKEIVVALDSCFSGAGGRSVIAKGARPLVMQMEKTAVPSNVAVLSAASGDQISSTYEEKGHGLFTYFMLKGLKGEAETNGSVDKE